MQIWTVNSSVFLDDHCQQHLVTVQSANRTTLGVGDILTVLGIKSLYLTPAGLGGVVSLRCIYIIDAWSLNSPS